MAVQHGVVNLRVNDLIDGVKKRQNEIAIALVNGGAINIESYHRLVGQNQGLQEALDILNQLLEEENKDVE